MRLGPLLLAASLTLRWTAPAQAETSPAQALQQQAAKAAEHGEHRAAIRLLEQAYEAEPTPDTLLEIAQQYDALLTKDADPRDIRLAIVHYRLAQASEQNPLERKAIADRLLALHARLASQPAELLATPTTEAAEEAEAAPEAVQPGAPPRREVRISFVAESSDDVYTVDVAGKACQTPCSMLLAPGNYVLTTGGAGGLRVSLLVPETDGVVRLPLSRRSYLPTGVLLTVVGPIVAGTLWLAGLGPNCNDTCLTANLITWPLVGTAMLGVGIGLLASYGSRNPDRLDVEPDAPPPPAVRMSFLGVQPIRSGLISSIGFSF